MSSSIPLLDALIPELWLYIFSIACVDDGSMGRTLSLVSRDVNQLSSHAKYQSICIVGLRKATRFLCTLREIPDFRRRIRYLCISNPDAPPDIYPDSDGDSSSDYSPSSSTTEWCSDSEEGSEVGSVDELGEEFEPASEQEFQELTHDLVFLSRDLAEGTLMDRHTKNFDFLTVAHLECIAGILELCHTTVVQLIVHLCINRRDDPLLRFPSYFPELRWFAVNLDLSPPGDINGGSTLQGFPKLESLGLRLDSGAMVQQHLKTIFSPHNAPLLACLQLSIRKAELTLDELQLPGTVTHGMVEKFNEITPFERRWYERDGIGGTWKVISTSSKDPGIWENVPLANNWLDWLDVGNPNQLDQWDWRMDWHMDLDHGELKKSI